ncbi:hypothetical protein M378DRAFT_168184 [Amanita muscaria Koide BX008]|uniref:Uncharacterized protein n=1 Tax=Amanita muscaria (strain Koide BX008) TaxID=946122 RepID=A0A0C2SC33_AMAMK|nr:hypothetical protein M378DRAFT_168184 [Amanita muscaria Koide BX008]
MHVSLQLTPPRTSIAPRTKKGVIYCSSNGPMRYGTFVISDSECLFLKIIFDKCTSHENSQILPCFETPCLTECHECPHPLPPCIARLYPLVYAVLRWYVGL